MDPAYDRGHASNFMITGNTNAALIETPDGNFACITFSIAELTSDYILSFDGGPKSYSKLDMIDDNSTSYSALSVAMWIKTSGSSHSGIPFSYANYEHQEAFTIADHYGYCPSTL